MRYLQNVLFNTQPQFLNFLFQRRLQVAFVNGVFHKEGLKYKGDEDTVKTLH